LKFMPKPLSLQDALGFVLPFGKHRGRTLGEVAALPDGLAYLAWLGGQANHKVHRAASIVAEFHGGRTSSPASEEALGEV
jgi:hypothetical protein